MLVVVRKYLVRWNDHKFFHDINSALKTSVMFSIFVSMNNDLMWRLNRTNANFRIVKSSVELIEPCESLSKCIISYIFIILLVKRRGSTHQYRVIYTHTWTDVYIELRQLSFTALECRIRIQRQCVRIECFLRFNDSFYLARFSSLCCLLPCLPFPLRMNRIDIWMKWRRRIQIFYFSCWSAYIFTGTYIRYIYLFFYV